MKKIILVFAFVIANILAITQVHAEDENVREIVFDTETTGFSSEKGDKIVEIGAIELINHAPTGKEFHKYINPERDVPERAVELHGLTGEFLSDKPTFKEIAQEWLDFVGDDVILIAHNAPFDMRFVNAELKQNGFKTLENYKVIDTLAIAQSKFPGDSNKLSSLCKRYNIDDSARTLHGALVDTNLLYEVYLKLIYPRLAVERAIKENKKLKITYHSNPRYKNEVTTRVIVPYRMAYGRDLNKEGAEMSLMDDELYLKAFCEMEQAERTFMVDRIQRIEIMP